MRALFLATALIAAGLSPALAQPLLCPPVASAAGKPCELFHFHVQLFRPESRDFMITPVAPHLHIGRSMIVPGDMTVTLQLETERPAVLSVDGTDEHELSANDRVDVCRSELVASFARLGPRRYFYAAIADRLK